MSLISFTSNIAITFRNKETKRLFKHKLTDTEATDILHQFTNNYNTKENIGDVVGFQIQYTGTDGEPNFSVFCEVDLDTPIKLSNVENERRNALISHLPLLFTDADNAPFVMTLGKKTAILEVATIEIVEDTINVEQKDDYEPEHVLSKPTATPIAVEKEKKTVKSTVKKEKEPTAPKAEGKKAKDNLLQKVDKLAEEVNSSVSLDKSTKTKRASAVKAEEKIALREQKMLAKQQQTADKKATLAEEKKKASLQKKEQKLEAKKAEKTESKASKEALLTKLASMTEVARDAYIEKMAHDAVADKQNAMVHSMKIAVQRKLNRDLKANYARVKEAFKRNPNYTTYTTIVRQMAVVTRKYPDIPVNAGMVSKIVEFKTALKCAYETYIDVLDGLNRPANLPQIDEEALRKISEPALEKLKTLFEENKMAWLAKKPELFEKFEELCENFAFWKESVFDTHPEKYLLDDDLSGAEYSDNDTDDQSSSASEMSDDELEYEDAVQA